MLHLFFFIYIFFRFLFCHCFGDIKSSDVKVLICGVIKNGEKGFGNVKKCSEELGDLFADYRVIVYENNSIDATKNLYNGWAHNNQKVIFISEDLTQDFLDNYTVKIGDYRTQFIARARNIVLGKALSSEFDDFSYHIMVDLDGIGPWPVSEIINTIENPEQEWDAVCANGSYDLYALRSNSFRLNYDCIGSLWYEAQPKIGRELKKILANSAWYPVESAFGGLALYKRDSIKNCFYRGIITNEYLEKILFASLEQDFIYKKNLKKINEKIDCQRKEMIKWKMAGFSRNLINQKCFVCEHVMFHFDMISNGHDKIFINPNLKVISLEHPNY